MKIDENLPESAVTVVRAAGHDVDTVRDEGLTGASNPRSDGAAIAGQRMVFTLDRGFGDLARTVGTHAWSCRVPTSEAGRASATDVVGRSVRYMNLDELGGCTVIVQPDRVRIRRPD